MSSVFGLVDPKNYQGKPSGLPSRFSLCGVIEPVAGLKTGNTADNWGDDAGKCFWDPMWGSERTEYTDLLLVQRERALFRS